MIKNFIAEPIVIGLDNEINNNVEIWKDIVGYEGLYEVSNQGRVRSLDRITNNGTQLRKGKILKGKIRSNGYASVHLSINGKTKWLNRHRIVALAFLPNPNNYPVINHKNEDKTDNRVENLEWCTIAYNTNYGNANAKRSKYHLNNPKLSKGVSQYDINGNFIRNYPSIKEAERVTGVDSSQIGKCCNHLPMHHTAGGSKWEYT